MQSLAMNLEIDSPFLINVKFLRFLFFISQAFPLPPLNINSIYA